MALYAFSLLNLTLPTLLASSLSRYASPTGQQRILMKCFSLLLLGMFLATLSTVNFSLAFLIGLLAVPLSFLGVPSEDSSTETRTWSKLLVLIPSNVILHCLSPPVVIWAVCRWSGISVEEVLTEAAFGWKVWGLWTQVVIWCVWWPAWLIGAMFVSPSTQS